MRKNIVLIGMPGSGKTTIARLLSERLERDYVDLDDEIEKYTQQEISELFDYGEKHFRKIESEVINLYSKKTGLIIATGGGAILKKENVHALRENGILIFLDRSLDVIADDVDINKRPLLKEGKERLRVLFEERYELYKQYADIIITNDESPQAAIDLIIRKLKDV